MLIDCGTCTIRGTGCSDCVVTALLGDIPAEADDQLVLDPESVTALAVLADAGLVAPLRMSEPAPIDQERPDRRRPAV